MRVDQLLRFQRAMRHKGGLTRPDWREGPSYAAYPVAEPSPAFTRNRVVRAVACAVGFRLATQPAWEFPQKT